MDESFRAPSWRKAPAIPLLFLLMVPLAILMALAYYVRAVVQLFGRATDRPAASPMQGPHFSTHAIAREGESGMRVVILGLGLVLAAGVAGAGDAKDDLAKLQGKWTTDKEGKKIDFVFEKNKFAIAFDGKEAFKGTIKIDSSKSPKHMDLTVTEGEKFKGQTSQAIYAVEGDTFKWCANEPGRDGRPKEFTGKDGDKRYLNIVFKRAK
jgi:uncharacterized protein (TIGR03067 family)